MKPFESFVATLAPLRAGLLTCLLVMGAGSAAAADNPYNLIEPGVISVGTMGDSKPYTFATADGQSPVSISSCFSTSSPASAFKKTR